MAKKLGYAVNRNVKGEYYKQPDAYEIFPVDAVHTVDLKHMLMYESKSPMTNYRIYRSAHNSRCKPTQNVLSIPWTTRNAPRPDSALGSLFDEEKVGDFKLADPNGLFKQPYRPKSGATGREDMRNQFGKLFYKKNGNKYPSIS